MPRNGGLPCTPMSGAKATAVGCPGQCCQPVLCAPLLSHPMGCSNVASPGAYPCTLLGQSPPGLGVRQEEMKPKLSC